MDSNEPNDHKPALTVIVPAYNEKERVVDTLKRILALDIDLEINVIDDYSEDGTREVLRDFASKNDKVNLFEHPYNMGNGASVKTGMRNANAPVLVVVDADGQHPPEAIPQFFELIQKYDLVVGHRSTGTDSTLFRNFGNWVFNTFSSYVAASRIPDLTCGMRMMKTAVALEFIDLFPNGF
ncbi:MAG TPA: glycosyltransferase family 2 protein, partial [bacterium]